MLWSDGSWRWVGTGTGLEGLPSSHFQVLEEEQNKRQGSKVGRKGNNSLYIYIYKTPQPNKQTKKENKECGQTPSGSGPRLDRT